MNKRLLLLVAMLMAALLLLAACGGGDDEESDAGGGGQEETEEASPEDGGAGGDSTYTAVDFGFQGPESLPAGEVELTLENEGKEPHEMALVALKEGKTIEDVMAFIKKNGIEGQPPKWITIVGGISPVKPGQSQSATVSLKPGDHVAVCFVPSKKNDNQPHVSLGMALPITVE